MVFLCYLYIPPPLYHKHGVVCIRRLGKEASRRPDFVRGVSQARKPGESHSFCIRQHNFPYALLLLSARRLHQDVVFIIRKNGSVEGRTTLEAGPQAQGLPLTLLVDKGTASAAEVFAAAVR